MRELHSCLGVGISFLLERRFSWVEGGEVCTVFNVFQSLVLFVL